MDSGITTWYNPTDKPIKMKLYRGIQGTTNGGTDDRLLKQSPWMDVVVPAGKEVQLPSEYDAAVQRVDATGQVVDGKGVFLVRLNEKEPPQVHSSLVPISEAEARARMDREKSPSTFVK